MYLKPCRNCPHKEGCETKTEKLASLRGLGFTSVNFKCDKRLAELQPGQRVELELMFYPDETAFEAGVADGPDGSRILWGETRITQATVMAPIRNRILVWLDEVTFLNRNPIAVRPDRVTPIKGCVEVCPDCGQPEGTEPLPDREGHAKFVCMTCEGISIEDFGAY